MKKHTTSYLFILSCLFLLSLSIAYAATFSITVNDTVTRTPIQNFCAFSNTNATSTCFQTTQNITSLLDPDGAGANSRTREQNYYDGVEAARNEVAFNTTQTFTNGTVDHLWVPWMDSSTSCSLSNFKEYGSITNANTTHNVMVTDEFSEAGIVLAAGNRTQEDDFELWYNTATNPIILSCDGLPCWVVSRNNTQIRDESGNDTASDATHRVILAMFTASQNQEFGQANRTKYLNKGLEILARSLAKETVNSCQNTLAYGQVCYWQFGGIDAKASGISNSDGDPDEWTGYHGDAVMVYQAGCNLGSNLTYCRVAGNLTLAHLVAANYTGGTAATDFHVVPFNYLWRNSTGIMIATNGSGTNNYHWNPSNEQWDDSDAPRVWNLCANLRWRNITNGALDGPYQNLSDYCNAWSKVGVGADATCLQYKGLPITNASCITAPLTGYYQNGLGAMFHTYYNISTLDDKLDEAIGHYGWSTNTFDSTSCGNVLTYRGVRSWKSLAASIGKYDALFSTENATCQDLTVTYTAGGLSLTLYTQPNGTNVTNNYAYLNFSLQNNNASGTSSTVNATPPQWYYNTSLCTVNPGWTGGTYSAATCTQNFTGSGNMFTNNLTFETNSTWGLGAEYTVYLTVINPGGTNNKLHPTELCTTTSGDNRFNMEAQNATHWHVKADRGGFSSTTDVLFNATTTLNFTTNNTNNVSRACIGTSCTNWETFTRVAGAEDCFAFEFGSGVTGGTFRVLSMNVSQNTFNYSATMVTSLNKSMNVTILNVTSGVSTLSTQNDVANQSSVAYNWTGLSFGTQQWIVNVKTANEERNFTTFSYTYINGGLPLMCTTSGQLNYTTLSHGTYNVTVFNISGGTYFNQTRTNLLINSSINQQNLSLETYQALLNISIYRLFLNTSISTFNLTNGYSTNTTTTGTALIFASNGSNNLKADVQGNYSLNQTCTVTAPLQTQFCNITGIYDSILTLAANNGTTALANFSVGITNLTLGGLLGTAETTGYIATFNLLQGYSYGLNYSRQGYTATLSNVTVNTSAQTVNVSLATISIFVTFEEEQNRTILNGTNITATIIDAVGNENTFTTSTGTLSLVGIFLPGNYTIRYGAPGYSYRDYYFTLPEGSVNVTVYLLSSELYSPGVVEVKYFDGTPVPGAIVQLRRYYGIANVSETVQMGTTDNNGEVVFVAEVISSFYRWTVLLNGQVRFNTTVPELLALQDDGLWHKTFILGQNATETASAATGFSYVFSPEPGTYSMNASYNLSVTLTSQYWNTTVCTFTLINTSDNQTLSTTSSFCTNNTYTGTIAFTPGGEVRVLAVLNVSTDYFTNQYVALYQFTDLTNESFTLRDLADDLNDFNRSGFGGFSKFFLAMILIASTVFYAGRRTELINEPEQVIMLIFLMTCIFSYIGWMTMPITTPFPVFQQYGVAILLGLVTLVSFARKEGLL